MDDHAAQSPGREMSAWALIGGYAADLALGDPASRHPVAGFGRVAGRVERAVHAPSRARGLAYALGLVAAAALAGEALARAVGRRAALLAITWAALGGRSLRSEANQIAARLDGGDLEGARAALSGLVGRDTDGLDAQGVCRAVVESVAENTGDAVVGALLWATLAGPAGVASYRAANTLDAMVGHRTERYERFGWAAARLDDAMSWPAARAGAALAVASAPLVGGSPRAAWRTLRRDGAAHPSPNAGHLEAAFAGALGVRLGGRLSYDGRAEWRPQLGDGAAPDTTTVRRAALLSSAVGTACVALCVAARSAWERSR
jgi:adenosylcobinamide-phosphate synthase